MCLGRLWLIPPRRRFTHSSGIAVTARIIIPATSTSSRQEFLSAAPAPAPAPALEPGVHFPNGANGGTGTQHLVYAPRLLRQSVLRRNGDHRKYLRLRERGVYQIPLATVGTPVVNMYSTPVNSRHGVGMRSCYGIPGHEGSNHAFCGDYHNLRNGDPCHFWHSIANNDFLQIDSEIMQVTGWRHDSLTVTRGQQGTTAATHANGRLHRNQGLALHRSAGGASGNARTAAGSQVPACSITR